jgi:hypothetical protein
MQKLTAAGYLKYDPKHNATRHEKWWMILICNRDIIEYYKHWVLKFGTKIVRSEDWLGHRELTSPDNWGMVTRGVQVAESAWKSHVSIIKGEEPKRKDLWGKYEGKRIVFEYDNALKTNGAHWWINVRSDDFCDIRTELGLSPYANAPFHLTIGKDISSPINKNRERKKK